MAKDWKDTNSSTDTKLSQDSGSELSSKGKRAMQGIEASSSSKQEDISNKESTDNDPSGSDQLAVEGLPEPPYDESKLEYRTGSPHEDYQVYKGIKSAKRQHELGQQASTIETPSFPVSPELGEAINTTLSANKEANKSDETPEDEFMRLKYGVAPYTDAYPPVASQTKPEKEETDSDK